MQYKPTWLMAVCLGFLLFYFFFFFRTAADPFHLLTVE